MAGDRADAAEWTEAEKENVRIVNGFCEVLTTRDPARILSFFAADIVYRPLETRPAIEGAAFTAEIERWADVFDHMELRVLETFAAGPMVMNRRLDLFTGKRPPVRWEGVGVFFVKDGKIKEWFDYTIRFIR